MKKNDGGNECVGITWALSNMKDKEVKFKKEDIKSQALEEYLNQTFLQE